MLILTSSPTLLEALTIAIDAHPDLDLVGGVETVAALNDAVLQHAPDVLLVDSTAVYSEEDAELMRRVRSSSGVRVVALVTEGAVGSSSFLRPTDADRVLPFGTGLLMILRELKGVDPGSPGYLDAILSTAREMSDVVRRQRELLRDVRARMRESRRSVPHDVDSVLTPREQEVLQLLRIGLDVTGISRRLEISVSTVRSHVKHILAKLGVRSQLEAVTRTGPIRKSSPSETTE